MRPLRYSINVTLDGCCHHEAGLPPDEESMRYWTAQMKQADALLFGRVTYEMMESAWRRPATGAWPELEGSSAVPWRRAFCDISLLAFAYEPIAESVARSVRFVPRRC